MPKVQSWGFLLEIHRLWPLQRFSPESGTCLITYPFLGKTTFWLLCWFVSLLQRNSSVLQSSRELQELKLFPRTNTEWNSGCCPVCGVPTGGLCGDTGGCVGTLVALWGHWWFPYARGNLSHFISQFLAMQNPRMKDQNRVWVSWVSPVAPLMAGVGQKVPKNDGKVVEIISASVCL